MTSRSRGSGQAEGTDDPMGVLVGLAIEKTRTISESDIVGFAELTGDFAPHHVDEAFAARSPYGRRIAHGVLLLGYASAVSSDLGTQTPQQVVSLGYDRIRFIKPVFLGDTITIRYQVTDFDPVKRRTSARVEIKNQDGQLVAVATHLLQAVGDAPA
jgi:3-hydroxybutyryl-CoA dehydratase